MIRAWKRFFFGPISPIPLAVFRIAFGTIMTVNFLLMYGPDYMLFFGVNSVYPAEIVQLFQYRYLPSFDLMMYLPQTDFYRLSVFWLSVIAAVLVTVGFATRASTVLLFVCLLSLNTHFPMIVHAGDNFARLIALFLCFSPCGARLSVDFAIAYFKGKPVDTFFEPYGQRMIQLQLCFIYLVNVFYKSMGVSWQDGTAVYYATRLQEFFLLPIPEPLDVPILSQIATWSTLVIESTLGFLLWPRKTKYAMIWIALFFHLGLSWCFNLGVFEWVFIATLILFVEPSKLEFIDNAFHSRLANWSSKTSPSETQGAPSVV